MNVTAMIMPGSLAAAYFLGEHGVSQWQSVGASERRSVGALAGGYLMSTVGVHPDKDIAARTFSDRSGLRGRIPALMELPLCLDVQA